MKKISFILTALILIFTVSCKNANKKENQENQENDEMMEDSTENEITLTKVKDFPEYNDVTLDMIDPTQSEIEEGDDIQFKFDVENMELGEQTKDADNKDIANSDDGQHIHFIVDDEPYSAHYEDSFEKDLDEGNHIIVAFPARSYHMGIKNKNAFVAKKLEVGNPSSEDEGDDVDLDDKTLIYSRPKGTYEGDDTKKVLLDFYLLNDELSSDGDKVKATINDEEFMIDDWAPYAMEGLPMGENTVKLELVDNNGDKIDGPYNEVERKFTLKD